MGGTGFFEQHALPAPESVSALLPGAGGFCPTVFKGRGGTDRGRTRPEPHSLDPAGHPSAFPSRISPLIRLTGFNQRVSCSIGYPFSQNNMDLIMDPLEPP